MARQRALARLLPPESADVATVARGAGTREHTVENWRSSRTSRSSALTRSRSAVLWPSRSPWLRSCHRTPSRNVSALQPIFAAID